MDANGPNPLVWVLDRVAERQDLFLDEAVEGYDLSAVVEVLRSGPPPFWCPTLWKRLGLDEDVGYRRASDLQRFGTNLTVDLAHGRAERSYLGSGDLDPVRAVLEAESGSRSLVFNGPTGVGKTATVHALAETLAPDGWTVVRMTAADFLVGTRFLGEWQTRVSELVELLRRPSRVVLFVPAIDDLLSAGRSSSNQDCVLDQLLPHIESGAIAVIGETTPDRFAAGLGAIPATSRVFAQIEVREASAERTDEFCWLVAADTGVELSDHLVTRIRELADEYLRGVARPGRSLGLLRTALRNSVSGALDEGAVLSALEESTGVPKRLLDDDQPLDLAETRRFFERRVMGQPDAIGHAMDVVTLIKAGLTDRGRPNAVLLFVGPTGVGKTELARAMSEYLFGDANRLVRIDLSEYATYDSFERLIGTTRPGVLTEPLRQQPFSVVLLDEIEKGHPNVFDLCLQLFDDGRLTDGSGTAVDFTNAIIIITSNLGAGLTEDQPFGFHSDTAGPRLPSQSDVERALRRFFRPEFLNRIDRIVNFSALSVEVAERITRREIDRVLNRSGVTRRHIAVDVDPAVVDWLVLQGYSPAFGARPLKRTVEQHLLVPIAREIAVKPAGPRSVLSVKVREGAIRVDRLDDPPDGRRTGGLAHESATSAEIEELTTRVSELTVHAGGLAAERSQLLARVSDPGVWSDQGQRLQLLDRAQRLDRLLERVHRLSTDVERTRSNRDSRRRTRFVQRHRAELIRLQRIVDSDDLADAFVTLSLSPGSNGRLSAVGLLARMYLGATRRWAFDSIIVDDWTPTDPGEIFPDTATLLVMGAGASAILSSEDGLHQVRQPSEPRTRDVVRVDVVPVPHEGAPEFEITSRSIDLPGRLTDRIGSEASVRLVGGPGGNVTVRRPSIDPASPEDLALLVLARQRRSQHSSARIVRRYDLGRQALVRDTRSGRSTGRLSDVLAGDLDSFIPPTHPPPEVDDD